MIKALKDLLIFAVVTTVLCIYAYRWGYNDGHDKARIEADKHWMEALLERHLIYLVKKGEESWIEYRYVPKVRRTPVKILDEEGRVTND